MTGSTAITVGTFDHEVHELATAVLQNAQVKGLGSLEVKKSDEDNKYYITEPTVGRNNLQSYIAVAGGVNLTVMGLDDALNNQMPNLSPSQTKRVWIEEYSTLQALTQSIGNRQVDYKAILGELNTRLTFSTPSFKDPVPFMLLCKQIFVHKLTKRLLKSQVDGHWG